VAVPEEHLATDLLAANAQVVLVEPRRVRDRAIELNDEEAALAEALATTWGSHPPTRSPRPTATRPVTRVPRLHLPFDRLLRSSTAPVLSLVNAPESPSTPAVVTRGFEPVAVTPPAWRARSRP